MPGQSWEQEVSEVFDLTPRNGYTHRLWLPRPEQLDLYKALLHPTRHVCIDGPSGSGKSSLALTERHRAGLSFKYVRVSDSTTWPRFCKKLVTKTRRMKPRFAVGLKGGVHAGLPAFEGEAKLELEAEDGRSKAQIAAEWTVGDASEAILDQGITVIIDDLERAKDELIVDLADLAKEMVTDSRLDGAKLVLVGTDDVYDRMIKANGSLKGRMKVISLGAFPSTRDNNASWTYLTRGFEALGKTYYPGSKALKRVRSRVKTTKGDQPKTSERDLCIEAVFHAADGLPKSLTELGYEITASTTREAVTVGAAAIIDAASKMFRAKVDGLRLEYPQLQKVLKGDLYTRKVLAHLLFQGTGRIHSESRLVTDLAHQIPADQIRTSVGVLISEEILVRTGDDRAHLYFKDLDLAHTLSVLAVRPDLCARYGVNPRIFEPVNQGMLELEWEDSKCASTSEGESPKNEVGKENEAKG